MYFTCLYFVYLTKKKESAFNDQKIQKNMFLNNIKFKMLALQLNLSLAYSVISFLTSICN